LNNKINVSAASARLAGLLKRRGFIVTFAESCTGGLVSASFTENAGVSSLYQVGFVTYSNESKSAVLGVDPDTIKQYGAVSAECVGEMAVGAARLAEELVSASGTKLDNILAISLSGIAGPDGAMLNKPVGTVYIGLYGQFGSGKDKEMCVKKIRYNAEPTLSRKQIQHEVTAVAFSYAYNFIMELIPQHY
jgi:nicotinamide-nucleotide amidase